MILSMTLTELLAHPNAIWAEETLGSVLVAYTALGSGKCQGRTCKHHYKVHQQIVGVHSSLTEDTYESEVAAVFCQRGCAVEWVYDHAEKSKGVGT